MAHSRRPDLYGERRARSLASSCTPAASATAALLPPPMLLLPPLLVLLPPLLLLLLLLGVQMLAAGLELLKALLQSAWRRARGTTWEGGWELGIRRVVSGGRLSVMCPALAIIRGNGQMDLDGTRSDGHRWDDDDI